MVQHRVDDEISRQDQIFSAIAKELSLRVSRCDEAFVEVFSVRQIVDLFHSP